MTTRLRPPVPRYVKARPNRCGCPQCDAGATAELDRIVQAHDGMAAWDRACAKAAGACGYVRVISYHPPPKESK